jgi:hypothetical protein
VTAPACASCAHFASDPASLEAALPGLSALSSAHASSRSSDGLCTLHACHVRATARCAAYSAKLDP